MGGWRGLAQMKRFCPWNLVLWASVEKDGLWRFDSQGDCQYGTLRLSVWPSRPLSVLRFAKRTFLEYLREPPFFKESLSKILWIQRDYDHHRRKPYNIIGIRIIVVKNPINSQGFWPPRASRVQDAALPNHYLTRRFHGSGNKLPHYPTIT